MKRSRRNTVRHMPKIYGNLQPTQQRSFVGLFRFLRVSLIALISAGLVYIFFASPLFQVKKVEVQGALLVDVTEAQSLVPLNTSIWRIPKKSIERSLLEKPTVISVGVFRGLPDSVRIVVHEREPILTWQSGEILYLIDSDGYSFAQFPLAQIPGVETSAGQRIATIARVVDTKGLPVDLNTPIASRTFLSFLVQMQASLAEHLSGVTLNQLEISDTTYDLTYVSHQGMRVQFNTLADPAVQVRNLARMVREGKVNPTTSNVDLRIDHWAYVR